MRPRSVDELLFHMPSVARRGDGWARGFATSILRHSRRKGWAPSLRQSALMHRLVEELFAYADGNELDLIEE